MFAVIQLGSYQYKVSEGDVIETNRLEGNKEGKLQVEGVLLFADGSDIRVGQPFLKDVKVEAKIIDHTLDEKRIAFKYRRRKDYSFKKGHRQKLTALSITKIVR